MENCYFSPPVKIIYEMFIKITPSILSLHGIEYIGQSLVTWMAKFVIQLNEPIKPSLFSISQAPWMGHVIETEAYEDKDHTSGGGYSANFTHSVIFPIFQQSQSTR